MTHDDVIRICFVLGRPLICDFTETQNLSDDDQRVSRLLDGFLIPSINLSWDQFSQLSRSHKLYIFPRSPGAPRLKHRGEFTVVPSVSSHLDSSLPCKCSFHVKSYELYAVRTWAHSHILVHWSDHTNESDSIKTHQRLRTSGLNVWYQDSLPRALNSQ